MIPITTKFWFSFDSLISYFFPAFTVFTFPALIEQLIKFDSWPARWSLYLDDALPIRGLWINHFKKLHSMHRSLTHTFAKLSNSFTYVRCAQKSLIICTSRSYVMWLCTKEFEHLYFLPAESTQALKRIWRPFT